MSYEWNLKVVRFEKKLDQEKESAEGTDKLVTAINSRGTGEGGRPKVGKPFNQVLHTISNRNPVGYKCYPTLTARLR